MLLLSHPFCWLYMLIIILVSIPIGYIIWFAIKCFRLRHKVNEYITFVDESYIQKGINPPTLILRIQREFVKEYNRLASNWMGSLFRIKLYPMEDELSETEVNYFDN